MAVNNSPTFPFLMQADGAVSWSALPRRAMGSPPPPTAEWEQFEDGSPDADDEDSHGGAVEREAYTTVAINSVVLMSDRRAAASAACAMRTALCGCVVMSTQPGSTEGPTR
jgi:hypothetical protein